MSGLLTRRLFLVSTSATGLLAGLTACPHTPPSSTLAPAELLQGSGLTEGDVLESIQRLRLAGSSSGELFLQRRRCGYGTFGLARPELGELHTSGSALRSVRRGLETDAAVGRLDRSGLLKLVTRAGAEPGQPLPPAEPAGLVPGTDHASPNAWPTGEAVAALHLELDAKLGADRRLETRSIVVENTVWIVTLDGRVHRRTVRVGRLDASAESPTHRMSVRTDLLDLVSPESTTAREALLEQLLAHLAAPPVQPPAGSVPLLLEAGGGAAWVAACDPTGMEEAGELLGEVDDRGQGDAPSTGATEPSRFRSRFDADLLPHPRSLRVSAEAPESGERMAERFESGLRVTRLADGVERDGGVSARVAEGWWLRPGHPPASVAPDTRVWLPTQGAKAVFGDDPRADHLDSIARRPDTPVLETAHPTVLFSDARVEAPHA